MDNRKRQLIEEGTPCNKRRAAVEAGWQQVEEGKVRDFDPEAIKRSGCEQLARLRHATR